MRLSLIAVCLTIALVSGAEKTASQLYKEAQRAEHDGDRVTAYLLYSEAAAKDPSNQMAWFRAQALRPASANSHVQTGHENPAPALPSSADPTIVGTITDQDIFESRQLLPPVELKGSPGTRDLDFRGDSKEIFEKAAKEFGLAAIFDNGYQPKTNLKIHLTESDYHDVFRALEAATDSFVIPVTSHQFLVANDSTQKRTELDKTAAVVIAAPEPFTIQEVQEVATGVRGTLDIQRLMVDTGRRLILIRDRISKVRMAQKLMQDLMQPKAEVAVEIELITTDQSSSLTYGMSLPSSFQLVWFGTASGITADQPSGASNYFGFSAGKSFLGLGVTDGKLFATASKSNSRTLLKSEVVTSDGQAATLHVGDKYPIQQSGYFGSSSALGQSYVPPPQVNYEDLGLVLKLTPHVHGMDEMTLEVESEFKLLGSQSVDGIPVISNRKFQSKVRLVNGEWAVLAGLMTDSDGITVSGIPGLSIVPVLRSNSRSRSHGETLIILKPHLLSMPPTEAVMKAAWVGTETKPRSAL